MGFSDDATLIPQVNGPIQWARSSVTLKYSDVARPRDEQ